MYFFGWRTEYVEKFMIKVIMQSREFWQQIFLHTSLFENCAAFKNIDIFRYYLWVSILPIYKNVDTFDNTSSKGQNSQMVYLWNIRSSHTKFQLPSSICSGDKVEVALFHSQKVVEPDISPPNRPLGLIFGLVKQLQILHWLTQKETIFAISASQHPLPQMLTKLNSYPRPSSLIYI